MWIVSLTPSRIGCLSCRSTPGYTVARHSLRAVSFLFFVCHRDPDRYSIGSEGSSGCCLKRKRPTSTAQTSVSSIMWPVPFRSARTGGEISAFISVFKKIIFCSLSIAMVDGRSSQCYLFEAAAIRLRFGPKLLNRLHNTKNDLSSTTFVGGWSPQIARSNVTQSLGTMSVWCDRNSRTSIWNICTSSTTR